jgi:hypothetical protein
MPRKSKYSTDEERKEAIKKQKREYAKRKRDKLKDLKGDGIVSDITDLTKKVYSTTKSLIFGRKDYPPKVRKIIENVGNQLIKSIEIRRTPLPYLLKTAINIVSLGEFEKSNPYDKLYHLAIVCFLENGESVLIEKNEVINMDLNPKKPPNTESININVSSSITLNQLLENTKKMMGDNYFPYNAEKNNCQVFIVNILKANNLNTDENEKFVYQDLHKLFEKLPITKKIMNATTDLGSKINILTQGSGLKKDVGKVLNHLVSHIIDLKEPVDKRDFKQAKMIITDLQKEKMGKGIESDSDSDSDSDMEGYGLKNYIVQSVIFDKSKYSIKTAKKWLKEKGYKSPKVDEEVNTFRFRQIPPAKVEKQGYTKYRNKQLKKGIILVLVYKENIKMTYNKKKISDNYIMPKFVKGSQDAKDHMKILRNMKGKGIVDDIRGKLGVGLGAGLVDDIRGKLGVGLGAGLGCGIVQDIRGKLGVGLGDGLGCGIEQDIEDMIRSKIGVGLNNPPSRSYGNPSMVGYGVHHHYHIQGGDILDDIRNALDPNRNGVAKAFDPNQNGIAKAFDPNQNGIAREVNRQKREAEDKVNQFTNSVNQSFQSGGDANKFFTRRLPSALIHQGIPLVAGTLGGIAAEALVPEGGPVSGFVGNQIGKRLGTIGADELGRATGYGFSPISKTLQIPQGSPQGNKMDKIPSGNGLKKGSQLAKDHMAKIRSMKKK